MLTDEPHRISIKFFLLRISSHIFWNIEVIPFSNSISSGNSSKIMIVFSFFFNFIKSSKRASKSLNDIFENDSLRQTVERLDPLIRRKKIHEIQWTIVKKTIEVLKDDIQSLTLLINGLKEKIEEKVG